MVLLTKEICIHPSELNNNIKKHILNKLKVILQDNCCEKDGYILSVNKITVINEIKITSANSDIICKVTFEAETLKPEVNTILCGDICMIFDKGIFVNVKNKIKVLIIDKSLSGYVYDNEKSIFIKDKKILKKGDKVCVKISGVQYSKKNFNCFGLLYNNSLKD